MKFVAFPDSGRKRLIRMFLATHMVADTIVIAILVLWGAVR
jgi:hypothetical protein